MKLIRTNGAMIPGGYVFSDPITGKRYTDLATLFDARVRQIINDRKANARLWKDPKTIEPSYVATLLSEQNCARLKGNRLFCTDGSLPVRNHEPAYTPQPAPAGKVCRWCRSDQLTEVLCATCGGRKRTGWKCRQCGKESPP